MFTPVDIDRLELARKEINEVLDTHRLDLDTQSISFLCAAIQNLDMAEHYVTAKFGKASTK